MGFRTKLLYCLVHQLNVSNKEAKQLLLNGNVIVSGVCVKENVILNLQDSVYVNGKLIRAPKQFTYYLFNKPVGIESTFSTKIKDNITSVFKPSEPLAIAGRLDKASEGLMILSNDGGFIEGLTHPRNKKEKEYIVKVNLPITPSFLSTMREGVIILGRKTNPCQIESLDDFTFTIILTEGRNRQIRRMCYKLRYEVVSLKRIRIDSFELSDLSTGELREFYV